MRNKGTKPMKIQDYLELNKEIKPEHRTQFDLVHVEFLTILCIAGIIGLTIMQNF